MSDEQRKNSIDFLIGQVGELKQINNNILERVERVSVEMNSIKSDIYGNGNIEKGILFRVSNIQNHVNFVKKFGWVIISVIATIPSAVMTALVIHMLNLNR